MSDFEVIPKALQRQALLFRKENNARGFWEKKLHLLANEIKRQRLENLCRIYLHPGPVSLRKQRLCCISRKPCSTVQYSTAVHGVQ